jgi:ribosomal peptide maturation radical SAM protein 1
MSDVVFVQMPFAGVERPSLALGLFMSSLKAARVPATSLYANISFAEQIGLPLYVLIRTAIPNSLLGEWIFAESAFGKTAGVEEVPFQKNTFDIDDEYVEFVIRYRGHSDLESLLLDLRRRASDFVDELSDQVFSMNPKVVACTSMFDQHVASLALLQRIKKREPRILTVIGGANCAGPMGHATHSSFPAVDFTATGEFDLDCVALFSALLAANGEPNRVNPLPPNILGPLDRTKKRIAFPRSTVLNDMDRAAIPDYDDYFDQLYSSPLSPYINPSIPLETSRGCWWGTKQHCTFCGLNAEGMAFRKKTPGRALREIRTLTSRYAVYQFAAADNIIDMSYFQTVLPELASDNHPYNFFYETKSNLKREQIQVFVDAGCKFIQPGIESLHDETLQIMKKGTTACANIQLLKHCVELGVTPAWSILCGFPGSDPEWVAQIAADLPMLFHLPPPNGTTLIRFDRFSPYHERPAAYGLTLEPEPAYRRVYPFEDAVLNDLAYFFYQTGGPASLVSEHAAVSWKVTARWRAEFWSEKRPELVFEVDDGDAIRIRDTRACAVAFTHRLDGRLAELLRALESPASMAGLETRLKRVGWGDPEVLGIADGLAQLHERRLIWRASNQYIALPTAIPVRRLDAECDAAVGKVNIAKYLVDTIRFRYGLRGNARSDRSPKPSMASAALPQGLK